MTSAILLTLTDLAKREGFFVSGGVDLEPSREIFETHFKRYKKWIEEGHQGNMGYLTRGLERRSDPTQLLPSAKSIFAVGYAYPAQTHGTSNLSEGVQYARYMRGRDYHLEMTERLEKVASQTKTELGLNFETKVCVDTSALLERTWASLCGIGWIGKNTMLIHPQMGSYFLLGFILLSESLGEEPRLLSNYCGSCTRCLDACPTQAFIEAGSLDARRCISYQTLENRGEIDFSKEELKKIGNRVAGCDICQEVCPFNTKASKLEYDEQNFKSQPHLFQDLLDETDLQYKERVKNSSLDRVKPAMFKRNLMICANNSH